jgi:hypothetical protein
MVCEGNVTDVVDEDTESFLEMAVTLKGEGINMAAPILCQVRIIHARRCSTEKQSKD